MVYLPTFTRDINNLGIDKYTMRDFNQHKNLFFFYAIPNDEMPMMGAGVNQQLVILITNHRVVFFQLNI